jgi:hypothetical protein
MDGHRDVGEVPDLERAISSAWRRTIPSSGRSPRASPALAELAHDLPHLGAQLGVGGAPRGPPCSARRRCRSGSAGSTRSRGRRRSSASRPPPGRRRWTSRSRRSSSRRCRTSGRSGRCSPAELALTQKIEVEYPGDVPALPADLWCQVVASGPSSPPVLGRDLDVWLGDAVDDPLPLLLELEHLVMEVASRCIRASQVRIAVEAVLVFLLLQQRLDGNDRSYTCCDPAP